MKLTFGAVTDRGLNPKRAANEDRFLVLEQSGLYLVADGVGGRKGGQVASQTVVDVFTEMFAKTRVADVALTVEAAVIESNRRIFEGSVASSELEGMATTVVVLAVDGEEAIIGHVGDSRVYRFERGALHRDTEDHSEVGEAVRAGVISAAMAARDPMRNVLTRAVGAEPDVEGDFKSIPLSQGTRFLLCSDGITRHLTDASLSDLLSS
ncbi:MAG: protein phosphatase 2C domain-containing protein, partial [Acidobacteriota bacterium]